jgi:hypothetical protein
MRKTFLLFVITAVFLGSTPSSLISGFTTVTFSFDREELTVVGLRGYDHITYRGCDLSGDVGAPQLPVAIRHIALPEGAVITGARVVRTEEDVLPGTYHPFPAQPPALLGIPGRTVPVPRFTEPDETIYRSREAFPHAIVEPAGTGNLGSTTIGAVIVYPLRYQPASRKLILHTLIELEIKYERGARKPLDRRETSPGYPESTRSMAETLTAGTGNLSSSTGHIGLRSLDPEDFPYVIITSEALSDAFTPLAEWKTLKGARTLLVTVEYIDQHYSGEDLPERIRNFIIDAYQSGSLRWVLLGGDTNVVPERVAWAMDCEAGMMPDENDIRADLYYADLDGTWDANANGTYGEVDDEVDLYPEVLVGRAPVEDVGEAEAFVAKLLAYERWPTSDYQTNFLMSADVLWHDPFTDASIGAEMIDSLYIPPRFDPITKLYQTQGNSTPGNIVAALNEGQNFYNHDSHCFYDVMGAGTGNLGNYDMDNLSNGERNGILYSIGCWPAAFDYDCIAEHFVTNPDGGGIAFLGNSRYGWGSPGNPGFGYSERYVHQYYRYLFLEDYTRPSAALAMSKAYFASRSQTENVYRIHQYQVNLLGDPEMRLWTDIPAAVTVDHPDSVSDLEQPVPIAVRTSSGPVPRARVCVTGDSLYQVGFTDDAGRVTLTASAASEDSLLITVTARDIMPYEGVIRVGHTGPYVTIAGCAVSDVSGNDDGMINPGEEITLSIELMNSGTEDLMGVTAVLDLDDVHCVLLDSSETFGDIAVGQTAAGQNGVRIEVSADCPVGKLIYLPVALTDGDQHVWSGSLSFITRSSSLGCYSYLLDDMQGGDGDSLLDPGENAVLRIFVANSGLGYAHDVEAELTALGPSVELDQTSFAVGTMLPAASETIDVSLSSTPDAATPSFPAVLLDLTDADGSTVQDTVRLTVATERLADDFESGEGRWQHTGVFDKWHLSTLRPNSGEYSWYCGNETLGTYENRMRAQLLPPAVFIAPNARISFWCWYEVTIYGVDGLYVQANDGTGWVDLDFIGSGGALDSLLNTGEVWHKESYDLSHYPVGTRVELRLMFVSDNYDVAEGLYLDDFSSNCPVDTTTTVIEGDDDSQRLPKAFALSQNYPNPFNPMTTISFDVAGTDGENQKIRLEVYDLRGRHVRTLVDRSLPAGTHTVTWDGRNGRGERVASGIYLYRLKSEEGLFTKKMTVLE